MSIWACPACGLATPRLLDESSKTASVNYYRCEGCGHVWSAKKEDGVVVKHITPLVHANRPDR